MTCSSGSASFTAGFTIRPATPADTGFMFSLAPLLSGVPAPPWHDLAAMEAFQQHYMVQTLGVIAEGALTLVAVSHAGEALGFIHAYPGRDGVTEEPCGYVSILAVHAAAEGLGVARQLMAQAEDWARAQNYRFLSLDVFADNERAKSFYRRGGFQAETIRMVKPL